MMCVVAEVVREPRTPAMTTETSVQMKSVTATEHVPLSTTPLSVMTTWLAPMVIPVNQVYAAGLSTLVMTTTPAPRMNVWVTVSERTECEMGDVIYLSLCSVPILCERKLKRHARLQWRADFFHGAGLCRGVEGVAPKKGGVPSRVTKKFPPVSGVGDLTRSSLFTRTSG